MKKFYTLLILSIIATINLFAIDISSLNLPKSIVLPEPKNVNLPKINAEKPPYVIFDNFVQGDKNHEGTIISNLFELCYYDMYAYYPSQDFNYQKFMLRTQYSDAFFSQYKITDFDVAIFPLGEYPLNTATQGGMKVIDKIKEMLEAGKRVLVIGRRMILWAFVDLPELQAGKDPVVIDFLTKTLGMKKDTSSTMITTISGGGGKTWIPFHIRTEETHPSTKGYDIYCNVAYGRNVEPKHPIIYQDIVDFFQLQATSDIVGTAFIDEFYALNQEGKLVPIFKFNKGQRFVGLGGKIGDGKLALWTLAPDVAGGSEITQFHYIEQKTMDWFTIDLPKPVPYIEFETTEINFGETLPESEKFKELRFRNFGRQPFQVTKIALDGYEDPGVFTLLDVPTLPLTLQPEQVASIRIKFRPNGEREFEDAIIFETTAINGASRVITLKGVGGKNAPVGPEITVQKEPFDFGVVDIGTSIIKDIFFESSGTAPLIVSKIEFLTNDGMVFNFPKTMNYPIVVQPGKIYTFQVKYTPRDYGMTYNATLKITSDAKKNPVSTISLVGKTPAPSEGAIITASVDTLKFPGVVPLHTFTQTFDILNIGKKDLRLNKIYFSANDEDVFSIPEQIENGTPITIEPSKKLEIPVSFKPYTDGAEYFADLGFFTNATNEGGEDFHVYFVGTGDKNGVSVSDNHLTRNLSLNVYPNPSNENINLIINSNFIKKQVSIKLSNTLGQTLEILFQGYLNEGLNYFSFDNKLKAGNYFIIIEDGQNQMVHSIIIIK